MVGVSGAELEWENWAEIPLGMRVETRKNIIVPSAKCMSLEGQLAN